MRELIREFIRSNNLLDQERLEEVFRLEEESGQTFERIMLHKGYMSENDLLRTLAHALELPYLPSLSDRLVPDDFVSKVPVHFARNYYLVAVGRENGTMQVATASPFDAYPMDDLATMLGMEIEPVLAPRTEITSLINKAYKNKADVVDEALGEPGGRPTSSRWPSGIESRRGPPRRRQQGPDHQAGQHDPLPGAEDARLGHPPPALRGPAPGALPHRRHPLRHGGRPEEGPGRRHLAHQGHGQAWTSPSAACRRTAAPRCKLGDADVDVRISSVPTNYGERIVMRLLDKTRAPLQARGDRPRSTSNLRDRRAASSTTPTGSSSSRARPARARRRRSTRRSRSINSHAEERDDDRGPDRVPPRRASARSR